jgi:hypothetical protein
VSMTPGLGAGDLCEIVDHPFWGRNLASRVAIGLTVVLTDGPINVGDEYWSPWWRVSGLPAGLAEPKCQVSHRVLRKIPPAPMQTENLDVAEV